MNKAIAIRVGGSAWDDGADFLAALRASESGEVGLRRLLAFESWDALAEVLTKGRIDLLRHLHECPATSIGQLADGLKRPQHSVHDDVTALESVGLIERGADLTLRVVVDAIHTEVRLDQRSALAGV